MRAIPPKHRKLIDESKYFKKCARASEGGCMGRITIEHVFIYAGRQISEMWNYLPLCWRHHLGDLFDKRVNEGIAISRATTEDLKKYPRRNWEIYKNAR